MRVRLLGPIAVAMMGGWLTVACAQTPAAPTPAHPIDTKPEGQGQECPYTVSKTSGATPTGTSTCPAKNDVVPPAPALPGLVTSGQTAPTTAPAPSAAQKFPFPGDAATLDIPGTTPDAPAPAPNDPGFKDAGSSGSSSSSSDSSSSSSSSSSNGFPDTADGRAPGDTSPLGEKDPAPKRSRKKLPPVVRQTPDEREAEDVQIAKFYMNDSNFRAAYLRAKDAVSISDDDAEAHLLLGDAARKLGKLDEAQQEYRKVIKLDPVPKMRKSAEQSLKEMGGTERDSLIP